MTFLLDTSILSDLLRNPSGRAARVLARRGDDAITTSVVVAGELRYGCRKRGSARLTERVEAVLSEIEILPLTDGTSAAYGDLRAGLEAKGQVIGGNDLWIAAQALAMDLILVTDNEHAFRRVPGLQVENWLGA